MVELDRWSHSNDLTYDALKLLRIRPMSPPEIMPGEKGYNPFQGVPNPSGFKVIQFEKNGIETRGYLELKPSGNGIKGGIGIKIER